MKPGHRFSIAAGIFTFLMVLATLAAVEVRRRAATSRSFALHLQRALELLAPNGERLLVAPGDVADAEIRSWAAASGLRVTLIDASGRVVADSWTLPVLLGRLENHLQRPEVRAALAGRIGLAKRHSATTDRPMVYAAIELGPPEHSPGFLRLAGEEPHSTWPWLGTIGALVAAALAAWLAHVWANRSQRAVSQHLQPWTDLPAGSSLAAMAEEADRRFRETREGLVRELEATRHALAEVAEGVVMLDMQGTVRFVNPAAEVLLGSDLAVGRPFIEAVRAPELTGAVDEALRTGSPRHTNVRPSDGGELVASVCPVSHPTLALAVTLRDTREQRQLERARRALVADLAHELRTPLTVLGALAEEFREGGTESDLVATLERQVTRLRAFAEELEELAAIESGQVKLHPEDVDVDLVVREALHDLEAEAHAAGVTLAVSGRAELHTDPVRLGQVVTNLVENGIRYNRRGGSVSVRIEPTGEAVRIDIEDDGIGIPAADIPLVFQRFYQVRRGAGAGAGSGLGLAIVKHLMRALGGTVQLTSQEGAGTTVTVEFPRSA
jgi:two-component system, OmpR family, phosphate regulon sensor histidine kinase PhoR